MSNWQQVAGGVLGAVGGFFAGGPVGAIQGFALGFAIASYVFPPKIEGPPKSKDPFQVTGASQGAPWPVAFGRRILKGNVIFFDNLKLRADEVTPSGKGKGIGKGASDDDYGVFYFAPVGIGLCVGRISQLHAILDSKLEDWDAETAKRGGDPYTLSTPANLQDFGYGPAVSPSAEPASSPLRVCSHVYSPKAYLGKNVTNMTPLNFDATVAVSQASITFVGDPLAGMPAGCVNPANIYYDILCDSAWSVGLAESFLSQSGFQAAAEIYRTEGLGLAPYWTSLTALRSMVAELNFHTHSIFRRGADGKLEPYPLRATNYVAIPLPESDMQDENAAAQTWDDLPNVFTASFRDAANNFVEKTIPARNEAAIRLSGKQTPKSYDFPHITNEAVMRWRLEILKRRESYPYIALSLSLPIKYHKLLVGDVVVVNNSKLGLTDFLMRVSEIKRPEFGKVKMTVKLIQEVSVIEEQLTPPVASPIPVPAPDPEPLTPVVGHWEADWPNRFAPPIEPPSFPPPGNSRPGPDGGPFYGNDDETGYFGYPLFLLPGAGKASDVGAGFAVAQGDSTPLHATPTTLVTRKAYSFRLDEAMTFGWRYAADKKIKVTQLSLPSFPFVNQDSPDTDGILDLDRSPIIMLIGNYEICSWGRARQTGETTYEFERVMRGQNKVPLRTWPVGTLITVFHLRVPAIQGSDEWISWAHRPRGLSKAEYDAGKRVSIYASGISYSHRIQSTDDQAVIEAAPLMSVAQSGTASSSLYKPQRLLRANRCPMVAAQAIKIRNSISTERDRVLWYPLPATSLPTGGWIVQIQPILEFGGLGEVVICDSVPETPVGALGGVLPSRTTDFTSYDQFTQDVQFGRVWEHFRLRIYSTHAAWIAQGTPTASLFTSTSLNSPWPTFIVDPSQVAGLDMKRVIMVVDVLAKNGSGEYSPPSFVSVHGVGSVLQYAEIRGQGLNDPDAP